MTPTITRYGYDWRTGLSGSERITKPATLVVLLHDDSTDTIQYGDDIDAIGTEPAGASYARATPAADAWTDRLEGGRVYSEIDHELSWDVSDSSGGIVDSVGVCAEFQALGDSSPAVHLLVTCALPAEADLDTTNQIGYDSLGWFFPRSM